MKVIIAIIFLVIGLVLGNQYGKSELSSFRQQTKDNEAINLNFLSSTLLALNDPEMSDVAKRSLNRHLILRMVEVTESDSPSAFASETKNLVTTYIVSSPTKQCHNENSEQLFKCEKELAYNKLRKVIDGIQ
ncbi:hypothetical protein [Neptunicella marina]|uniref:Uncharacterized protein n=1 Tax=Neptunicella marina TaxID=2125989 RepID=A0A8J6IWS0_9ALTE|nr:hypothetical protein [Neptunicella marina]MBC3767464.1 hypothetical protein [Neptunicella marina]